MDGSTDRCPQCGAAIRPSARYCVTCGVKLPESAAKTAGAATSGWAAREENVESSDSVASSPTAWAMPATHADDPQSNATDTPESEETAPLSASTDEDPQ